MTNRVSELKKLGQSLWFDQMERSLITTGELHRMIAAGEVLGLTSNPTIFQKAITGSDAYDDTIQRLAGEGKSARRNQRSSDARRYRRGSRSLPPGLRGGQRRRRLCQHRSLAGAGLRRRGHHRRGAQAASASCIGPMCWSRFPPPRRASARLSSSPPRASTSTSP